MTNNSISKNCNQIIINPISIQIQTISNSILTRHFSINSIIIRISQLINHSYNRLKFKLKNYRRIQIHFNFNVHNKILSIIFLINSLIFIPINCLWFLLLVSKLIVKLCNMSKKRFSTIGKSFPNITIGKEFPIL